MVRTRPPPYSADEDLEMLSYVIANEQFGQIKGKAVWKAAHAANVCPQRTWESMKARFRKEVMPNIDRYDIAGKARQQLIDSFKRTTPAVSNKPKTRFTRKPKPRRTAGDRRQQVNASPKARVGPARGRTAKQSLTVETVASTSRVTRKKK